MARVVLDTNAFLDCWVFDDPAARALKAALESGRVRVVRSAATDAELAGVLVRPQFGLAGTVSGALIERWQQLATCIAVEMIAPVRCADPADQMFLDLALAAHADALITKDMALLATATRARLHGLSVVTPHAAGSVLLLEDRVA
jgi:putative PIN family toxin of toxin-antitoxin system